MEETRDDPRDVLALLNALGFVGITAPQLKAFMKDLKMHRKIKQREREQWKEITTKKILTEQECMFDDLLRDIVTVKQSNSMETSTESDNSDQQEDPLVRIRVHHVSVFEDNRGMENEPECNIPKTVQKPSVHVETERVNKKQNYKDTSSLLKKADSVGQRRERSKSNERPRPGYVLTASSQAICTERRSNGPQEPSRNETHQAPKTGVPLRPFSAPILTDKETVIPIERSKSAVSDSIGLANARQAPSRCSTHSQTKSFIRPWELQPEAHKTARAKKCDPVSLYQKYQQEWKQISFPGEDQHTRLRWAIREKMLGTDPNPRPIIKKSLSLMSIRKR